MADKTQLNKDIGQRNTTILNKKIIKNNDGSTVLNSNIRMNETIEEGSVLCSKYQVIEKMSVEAGEADLFICTYKNEKYVAKVYRRTTSIKSEVIQQLKNIKSKYVATVYEVGEYNGTTVEILPFYRRGNLNGRKFSYKILRKSIIPCLNEGLRALHNAKIIHKDLKPSNIMVRDDNKTVAIIDFGISSVTEPGNTVIVTQTGMTPEYSAPETFRGLYSSYADYYSLGITIYELFCGKTPYGNMPMEDIERYITIQRIPFPEAMPDDLKNLIKALTYNDISNRRDKNNPNRRWGYEEVKKWLAGEEQVIPGDGTEKIKAKPYLFLNKEYSSRPELVRALAENWAEGKKELFRGKLSDYYKNQDKEACKICQAAEREAMHKNGKDDYIYWKTLYALQPTTRDFFWNGQVYLGLPALGRNLLEKLRKNDSSMIGYMNGILKEELLSNYVMMKDPKNEKMINAVKGLEKAYKITSISRERQIYLYLIAYMLSNQKVFYINESEFHTLGELVSYMKEILGENNEHLDQFKIFCHSLMDQYDNLIPSLESWLIALGKRDALDSWKNEMETR